MVSWLFTYILIMMDNIGGLFVAFSTLSIIAMIIFSIAAVISFVDTCSGSIDNITEDTFIYYWIRHKKLYFIAVFFCILATITPNTKQCLKIIGIKKGYDIASSQKIQEFSVETIEKSYKILDTYLDSKLNEFLPSEKEETQ